MYAKKKKKSQKKQNCHRFSEYHRIFRKHEENLMHKTQLCASNGLNTYSTFAISNTLTNFVIQICFPNINFEVVAFPDTY